MNRWFGTYLFLPGQPDPRLNLALAFEMARNADGAMTRQLLEDIAMRGET